MRFSLLLLTVFVAGPALGQSTTVSRSGRSVTLRPTLRVGVAQAEMLPGTAVYSWVDEADGRFIAVQTDTYLTAAQRTAWAAGEDADALPRTSGRLSLPDAPPAPAVRPVLADGGWVGIAVVTCDVLKCVEADALGAPARPSTPATRS